MYYFILFITKQLLSLIYCSMISYTADSSSLTLRSNNNALQCDQHQVDYLATSFQGSGAMHYPVDQYWGKVLPYIMAHDCLIAKHD